MKYLGATTLFLVVLILGILYFSEPGVSGPEFFNMVTGAALVVAAFYAHRTWRKTEHWKVKKDAFSYLTKQVSRVRKFEKVLSLCELDFNEFGYSPRTSLLDKGDSSKEYISLVKRTEGKIRSKLAIVDIDEIVSTLNIYLISTDIKWAREYTGRIYDHMASILSDESGFDSFSILLNHFENQYRYEMADALIDEFAIENAKFIADKLAELRHKLSALEWYFDKVIDEIEAKLGSSF